MIGWMQTLAVMAVASLSFVLSCASGDCTSMGCGPALTIQLSEPLAGEGAYEIVGVMDGREVRCAYDAAEVYPASSRDCDGLSIGFDASSALVAIESPQVSHLVLSLVKNGSVMANKTFAPEYSFEELNGPGCGACPSARVSF